MKASPAARLFPQETSAAASAFGYDSSREKAILENPQIFQNCEIINILSAEDAQSEAERILNCPACGQAIKKRPALPVEMRGALVIRAVCLMLPAEAVPQRTGRQ